MAKCASCGSSILFGGKSRGSDRYCNDSCLQKANLATAAAAIPAEVVQREVQVVHQGLCPRCHGTGPVDVHTSHRVWSALVMTSWLSRNHVCCRSCGVKSQAGDLLFSLVLGWWGFPWGLLLTPVQVVRNLVGMMRAPDPLQPSAQLAVMVRLQLASQSAIANAAPERLQKTA